MKQYRQLIKRVMVKENLRPNRTGVMAYRTTGESMTFDLTKGFLAVTSKPLAFKGVKGEAIGFLNAFTNAGEFRALGCKVWDGNANGPGQPGAPNKWLTNPFRKGEDHLGPVYGVPWREWDGYKILDSKGSTPEDQARLDAIIEKIESDGWVKIGNLEGGDQVYHRSIDQFGDCVRSIIKDPDSRRILFHGWNPAILDEVALPACHLLYHFLPDQFTRELNMIIYLRSNDIGLGTPFNMAEAAFFMHVVGRVTGYTPKKLSYFIGDAHIYENQVEYLTELLSNKPYRLPTLEVSDDVWKFPVGEPVTPELIEMAVSSLKKIRPEHFVLKNYRHHKLVTPVPAMVV